MEHQELEQDIDLMPHHKEVRSPTSMPQDDEKVSNDQGGTKILGDHPKGGINNISFDESQHRVVQSHRVSTPEDQTSPTQVEERVIVTNVRKHPTALANATRVYAEATNSSV